MRSRTRAIGQVTDLSAHKAGSGLSSIESLSPNHWYQFDDANVTKSGSDITGVTDLGSGSIDLDGTGHAPLQTSSASFNGAQVAQFDGSSEYLIQASAPSAASGTYFAIAARVISHTSGDQFIIETNADRGLFYNATNHGYSGSGNGSHYCGAWDTNAFIACGAWQVQDVGTASTMATIWRDGKVVLGYWSYVYDFEARKISLGSNRWSGGEYGNIEIAELAIWDGPSDFGLLSIASAAKELGDKYGIDIV